MSRDKLGEWVFLLDAAIGSVPSHAPKVKQELMELQDMLRDIREDDARTHAVFGTKRSRGAPVDERNTRVWEILLAFICASQDRSGGSLDQFLAHVEAFGSKGWLRAGGEDNRTLQRRVKQHKDSGNGPQFSLAGGIASAREGEMVRYLESQSEGGLILWWLEEDPDRLCWSKECPMHGQWLGFRDIDDDRLYE